MTHPYDFPPLCSTNSFSCSLYRLWGIHSLAHAGASKWFLSSELNRKAYSASAARPMTSAIGAARTATAAPVGVVLAEALVVREPALPLEVAVGLTEEDEVELLEVEFELRASGLILSEQMVPVWLELGRRPLVHEVVMAPPVTSMLSK